MLAFKKRLIIFGLCITLLSACSSPAPLSNLIDGSCTPKQQVLVEKHISGQVAALSKEDFKTAYSFAAPSFQKSVSLEYFELIIKAQYGFLIANNGVEFGGCTIKNMEINQEVTIKGRLQTPKLSYVLKVDGEKLGVISALISGEDSTLKL